MRRASRGKVVDLPSHVTFFSGSSRMETGVARSAVVGRQMGKCIGCRWQSRYKVVATRAARWERQRAQ
jgi:hypothetical protein